MTTELEPIVPRMNAETGYEMDESIAPLRPSGFVSVILGVISVTAALGKPLLVVPFLAICFGFFALRRFNGAAAPVGTSAAKLGIALGFGFGALGVFLPMMKSLTLGSQAERFARAYVETIARGHSEVAMELRKDYVNRFPESMSLKSHYQTSAKTREAFNEFHNDGIHAAIRSRGPGAEWELDGPIDVFYSYGLQHAHLVLHDPVSQNPKVQMFLEYRVDRDGDGQWNVKTVQSYRELIVAPSVL
jgi:hypothetical protein